MVPFIWRVIAKNRLLGWFVVHKVFHLFRPVHTEVLLRARYAEDRLMEAISEGVGQYVILGAGLDTFSTRHKELADSVRIFELDHPATQAKKEKQVRVVNGDVPSNRGAKTPLSKGQKRPCRSSTKFFLRTVRGDEVKDYTMAMKNPPHPGFSIKENCLEPLGLNVTEAAKVLGVARHTLSRVLNGHAAISPEMAIRLEKAGWSNAEFWLRRQTAYNLVQARKREDQIKVKRYELQPTI